MMEFDEFKKLDLRIGEVVDVGGDGVRINCGANDAFVKGKLDVSKGDKVVVGTCEDCVVVLVVGGEMPIVPEKDIGVGVRIS